MSHIVKTFPSKLKSVKLWGTLCRHKKSVVRKKDINRLNQETRDREMEIQGRGKKVPLGSKSGSIIERTLTKQTHASVNRQVEKEMFCHISNK